MALQATFLADFASFYDAVQKAEVQLKSFDTGVAGVEKSLNKMTDGFSGRRIITEATLMAEAVERAGGVSTLTAKELQAVGAKSAEAAEKMRALGMEVPKNVQSLSELAEEARKTGQQGSVLDATWAKMTASFTAGAIIERATTALFDMGVEVFRNAVKIGDLSDKTKLSTDFIQEMMHVADQTGSSFEGMTQAAYNLGVRLAGGSGSVRDAVVDLGLDLEALRRMPLEQKWAVVTAALQGVRDESERNRLGAKLMGTAYEEAASAISRGYNQAAADASKMSESTIRAAQEWDDAWGKSITWLKAFLAEVSLLGQMDEIKEVAGNYRQLGVQLGLLSPQAKEFSDIVLTSEATQKSWNDRLREAEGLVAGLSREQLREIDVARRLGATNEELIDDFELTADALRVLEELQRKDATAKTEMAAAAKRLSDAEDELASAGDGWRGTLAAMNQETVAAIRYYLEAGVSQGALAIKYEQTATQVRAVASAIAEEERATNSAAEASERLARVRDLQLQAASKLWNEYNALVVERTGTTTDIQIAGIHRWAADIAAQTQRAGSWTEDFYNALQRLTKEKIDHVKVDWSALRDHSRLKLDETAEKARATYEAMLARSGEFSTGTIEHFRRAAEEAELAALRWSDSVGSAVDHMSEKTAAGARQMAAEAEGVALSWSQAMDLVGKGKGTMSFSMPAGSSWGWAGPEGQVFNATGGIPTAGPNMNYPGFANGVENFKGGLAYVHKDEALVNLSPGTSVIPASKISATGGRGSGGNTYNSFTINAGMGSSASEIARLVKVALLESARDMGQRLPSGGR